MQGDNIWEGRRPARALRPRLSNKMEKPDPLPKLAHLCPFLGAAWKTSAGLRTRTAVARPLRSLRPYKGSASRRPGSDAPGTTSAGGGEGRAPRHENK